MTLQLQVGQRVDVKGIGKLLLDNSANGSLDFIGRNGRSEEIVRYTTDRNNGVIRTPEGIEFVQQNYQISILRIGDSGYTQAKDKIRRAKI